MSILHKYLTQAGLIGWFASKLAIHIINSPVTINILESDHHDLLNLVYNDLNNLFANNNYILHGKTHLSSTGQYLFYPNPQFILLNSGKIIKIIDLIISHIQEGEAFPFNWIDQITLTSSMMCSLIDKSKSTKNLEDLLSFFVSKPIILFYNDQNLHSSHIQRILKIVKATNNPKILRGASIILGGSKFLKLAGSEQILRMLQKDNSANFVRYLFTRRVNEETNMEEKDILNEIAKGVMASPDDYPFRINILAADYLAESTKISLPPLITLEEELKIRISSK